MLDQKRQVKSDGPGRTLITVVPYKGLASIHEFHKQPLALLEEFAAAVQANQPDLCSEIAFTSGGWSAVRDPADLIRHWTRLLNDAEEESLQSAVTQLLDRVSNVLDSRRFTQTVYMCLAGLSLAEDFPAIEVARGAVLRKLSATEFERFASHDVVFGKPKTMEAAAVSACLIVEGQESFALTSDASVPSDEPQVTDLAIDASRHLIRALNVLKPGQVTLCDGVIEGDRDLFPIGRFGFNWPWQLASSGMQLTKEDVPELLRLLKRLTTCSKEEVRIAADRLVDAQARRSPVDVVVDCTVGLEVLLNPMDHAELSFRVALNYSYLWDEPQQRERFDQLRELQKVRNKIVHGGLSLKPKDVQLLTSHADQAKRCLQDALQAFLAQDSSLADAKLDAEFWLERVLPKH